jgi:hypothetical protein
VAVVHLLGIFLESRMLVALNVPDAVGESTLLCTGDFLLLETPVGEFDFVREQYTAGHEVDKLEFSLDSSQALLGFFAVRHGLDDLNAEQIVGITLEVRVSVGADFVLPVGFGDRWAVVVRVYAAVSDNVIQADDRSINDPLGIELIPCHRSSHGGVSSRIGGPIDRLRLVLNEEDIVLILMRVESNLLLLAASGVHVLMGVEVAALGVVVAEADTRTESDVSWDISHALSVES